MTRGPRSPSEKAEGFLTALIFSAAAIFVWWLAARRFILTIDEGICLEGAERILRGQVPYRNFFELTGPGAFWLEALAMNVFGKTLGAARLFVAADIGALAAGAYWLTARLAGRAAALCAAFTFLAFETTLGFRLYVNHRWDSSAFALIAVCLAYAASGRPAKGLPFVSGLLAAGAAWITPPMILCTGAIALGMVSDRKERSQLIPYGAGIAVCSALAGIALWHEGALLPMLREMLWTVRHYPAPNSVPYGYGAVPPSGLSALFAGWSAANWVPRSLGLIAVLMPPVLPLAVLLLATISRFSQDKNDTPSKNTRLLVLASLAFLASVYPRWSADQLLFITPIFYALAAYYLDGLLRPKLLRSVVFAVTLGVSGAALFNSATITSSLPTASTRVGLVRAAPPDLALADFVEQKIPPGSTLFVYPYLPVIYFLTESVNPTRWDFLQPGMMTSRDEAAALADLRADPPQRVFYFRFPPAVYQNIWPRANPAALKPGPMDSYIESHFHVIGIFHHPVMGFEILERNVSPPAARSRQGEP